jgi:hypothetical protein
MFRTLAASRGKTYLNFAKVGVEGSNPFARPKFPQGNHSDRAALWGRPAAYILLLPKM